MTRKAAYVLALLIVTSFLTPAPLISDVKNQFNFFIGQKYLHDDLAEDLDVNDQLDLGVEMSFGQVNWPVMIAVDILASGADETTPYDYFFYGYVYTFDVDVEFSTVEIDVGVRKTWEPANSSVRPYIGGGVALIRGDVELSGPGFSLDDDDTGEGYWIGGGVFWRLGQRFNIGFNVRYSKADVDLFRGAVGDVNVGGYHGGFVLGWGD